MQFNEQLFSTQREQYARPQPLIEVYLPMINTNLFINLGIIESRRKYTKKNIAIKIFTIFKHTLTYFTYLMRVEWTNLTKLVRGGAKCQQ